MLITLAVVNALSVQAPVNGATLRTWHMAEPMSAITPLVPGQAPNAWSLLETLDFVQLPSRQTQVYTLIDGTFVVSTPGEYCFELVSDDGSQLWVTGTKVVDNDGLHGPEAKTGCKTLDAGTHAFQVKWFQQGGGAVCQVRWKTPDSDAFTTIPTGAMTTDWPKQRPVDEAEKLAVGAPSHNRAGDGRPVSGSFPGWSCHPVMVSYDAPVVALAPIGHDTVLVGTQAGSVYVVDLDAGTAVQFAVDQPVPVAMQALADGGVLLGHADGAIMLRDTTGDGQANDQQDITTVVPPGPRRRVEDGHLRSRHGTVIARIDPATGMDRVLCEYEGADGATHVVCASEHELFEVVIDAPGGRERASIMRRSAPAALAATAMPAGLVVGDAAGITVVKPARGRSLHVQGVEPLANGFNVRFSSPVARNVLANPNHWVLTWIDAAGTAESVQVQSASPSLDGTAAFLEVQPMPDTGTLHARMVGPWQDMQGNVLWSPEVWASVHPPLPMAPGTVVPHVRPRMNSLSPRESLDGWTLLFDGRDAATHWRGFRKDELPEQWVTQDGELVFTGKGGGDIITREQYDDFDLHLEWMVQPKGNSGIFFNVAEDAGATWATGPEMQILDNARHADGASPFTSAGANYALHAPPFDPSLPAGRWNHARIRVDGDHVQYWLNGVKTAAYNLQSPEWTALVKDSKFVNMPRYGTESKGHIALQDHGDRVAFRNIRIKRLNEGQ